MQRASNSIASVTSSWRNQTLGVRVIRLWLGLTWIYAGWEKASNPSFLAKTGASSIHQELVNYSTSSPIGFILSNFIEYSTPVGIFTMVAEFSIGLATLLWIAPTFMAFLGLNMSLGLWLTATWHVKPYFLGSDTAYAVLWLSYFLTLLNNRRRGDLVLDRRGAIRLAALALAGIVATFIGQKTQKMGVQSSAKNQIIKLTKLPVGATYEFSAPDGSPAIVFRTKNGVFAYSQICTHQGCTVSYSSAEKVLVCPCHGARYNPMDKGGVLNGPAIEPLAQVKVAVDGLWVVLV